MAIVMNIVAVGILIAIVLVGFFTIKELLQSNKSDKKVKSNVNQAIRWRNYGHPFEVIDVLEKGKKNVTLPSGCLMEYEIKEKDGEWKMGVSVSDSLNPDKIATVAISLESFTYNKNHYKFIVYYDEHNGLFHDQSIEKVMRDAIFNLPKRAVEEYKKQYPFEFSKLERHGVL